MSELRVFPLIAFAGWGIIVLIHLIKKRRLHPDHQRLIGGCIVAAACDHRVMTDDAGRILMVNANAAALFEHTLPLTRFRRSVAELETTLGRALPRCRRHRRTTRRGAPLPPAATVPAGRCRSARQRCAMPVPASRPPPAP